MPKGAHGNDVPRSNPSFYRRQKGGQWCSGTACPLGLRCTGSTCAFLIASVQSALKYSLCFFSLIAHATKLHIIHIHQDLNFSGFSLFMFSPLLCNSSCICFKGSEEKAVPVNSGLAARPTALLTPHGVQCGLTCGWFYLWLTISG